MTKWLLFSLLTTTFILAEDITTLKDKTINPLNGYKVHDMELPHPKKVTVSSAITTAPPSDATVLFNGENTEAWLGSWKVENGILIASPGNLTSKESFNSCQLHLEFRIPQEVEANGQKGANSGIFLMGKYEVQVQESHTNTTYADGQAGAIYGQYPPLTNPSLPKGEWQSYDIIFKAPVYEGQKCITPAKISVLHNGVLIHHAAELLGPTTHKKTTSYPATHPDKAPLKLQWHQDPIQFRNIWIREIGTYPKK